MRFTGTNFRNVLAGTKGSFDLSINIDQITGEARFGLSGNSAVPIDFYFKSGRIFDPNDRYIYSYVSGESIHISGNFSGEASPEKQNYNYYINDELFCLSGVNNGGYNIEKFFINTTGCNAYANLDIYSSENSYDITMPGIFREDTNFTGYVTNNNATGDFRILSGRMTAPVSANVGGDTMHFVFTGSDSAATGDGGTGKIEIYPSGGGNIGSQFGIRYSASLDLYTNLGKITTGFIITGREKNEFNYFNTLDYTDLKGKFFEVDSEGNIIGLYSDGNIGVRIGSIISDYSVYRDQESYIGDTSVESGSYYYQSLTYENGYTGDLFTGEDGAGVDSSGSGVLTGSGYLEGSGNIVSGTTGDYNLSGVDTYNNVGVASNTYGLFITGKSAQYATGEFYWFATGNGELAYNITATGYSELSGDGGLSGTRILTTGTIDGSVIETGIGGSGAYASNSGEEYGFRIHSSSVTGVPVGKRAIDSLYYSSGLQGVGADSTNGGTLGHTGIFTGKVIASGTYEGITGSGNYSGFLSGYTKTFENTFNLKTGVYNEETTVDHKANGLTSGSPVVLAYRSSGHTDETPYSINSEIVFSPSFDNLEMEVEFLASGVNNLEPTADTARSVLITGKL